jgi:hypothetical protein
MDEPNEPTKQFTSVFLDPAWLVAFLVGCWGVVIAMEDFRLADGLAVAAGIVICLKVGAETRLLSKDRRLLVFVLAFILVSGIVAVDFLWTDHKKEEAADRNKQLSQLGELPGLRDRFQKMEQAQIKRSEEERVREIQSSQQLTDIQNENKGLRKSVETKDAALVSIAKDQYALNFFPQIAISTNGTVDTMYVTNNGKTNVEVYRLMFENNESPIGSPSRQTIAPGANDSFMTTEQGKQTALQRAMLGGGITSLAGTLFLSTLDKKNYRMTFTWTFAVKDFKIDKTFITDGPIVEEK